MPLTRTMHGVICRIVEEEFRAVGIEPSGDVTASWIDRAAGQAFDSTMQLESFRDEVRAEAAAAAEGK